MLLTGPSEGTQEAPQRRLWAFDRIHVYLAHAVSILVPRPLTIAMAGSPSVSFNLVVAFPPVGVYRCVVEGTSMDMWTQALPVGAAKHSQTHRPAFSALCLGPADDLSHTSRVPEPYWLSGAADLPDRDGGPLFSPRFETSRRSQFARRKAASPAGEEWHWLVVAGGSHGPSSGSDRALGPFETRSCLEQPRAKAPATFAGGR